MSVESTTRLEEEAKELAEGYFNSTPMAEILLEAIKRKDYENLRNNIRKYGLTVAEFEAMLAAQDGLCMICGKPPKPDGVRAASRLHIDHDHATGENRDLICLNCNRGLGYFKDDPVLMRAAAEYVERHRASVT